MLGRNIFYKTLGIVLTLWLIYFLGELGVYQKQFLSTNFNNGVHTIFTGPLLHGSLNHIIGNTRILLITIPLIVFLYSKDFLQITILGFIVPSIFAFLLQMNVIGISGLTFTYVWFLIFAGIGSKNSIRFICSIVFIMFYSSSLNNATPYAGVGIAWQSHFCGMVVGIIYSIYRYFRK